MAITGNVSLTSTFDQWRIKTNEIIEAHNQLELTNVKFVSGSTNTIQFSDSTRTLVNEINVTVGNTFTITCNALPQTGGTLTGDVTLGSLTLRANGMIILGDTTIHTNGMFTIGSAANTIIHSNGQIVTLGL